MAAIKSVQLNDGRRVKLGSKAYEDRIVGGATAVVGTGKNVTDEELKDVPFFSAPKRERMMVSSENAIDSVNQANESLANLTKPPEENKKEGAVSDKDLVEMFKEEDTPVSDELEGAEDDLSDSKKELNDLRAEIETFQISDAELKTQVAGITSRWDAKINEMREINRRREQTFETLGYRIGGQYSGGVRSGVFGGVIAEEERQGILRIGEFEALKQAEIATAKDAQRKGKWDIYVEKVRAAEKAYEDQKTLVAELNKKEVENRKKLAEEKNQTILEQNIAKLLSQGVTDAASVQGMLKQSGFSPKIKDVQDVLDIINPEEPEKYKGLTADYRTYKAMQESGEIPENWSYFQFEAALSNANRKPGGGDSDAGDPVKITPEDQRTLTGAGFTPAEISDIEAGVNDFGIDAVLETITDLKKKNAIKKIYGVQEQVNREQIESIVTRKAAQDGLKETYTTEELFDLAKEKGYASFWTGKDADVDRFLNSDDAKALYVDLLVDQYKAAGLFDE